MTGKKEEAFIGIDDRGNDEMWRDMIERVRVRLKEEWDALTPEEQAQRRAEYDSRKAAGPDQNNA
jgi:hypothetical protein